MEEQNQQETGSTETTPQDQVKEAKRKFRQQLRHLRDLKSRSDELKGQVNESKTAWEKRNATLLNDHADAKRQYELAEMQLRTAASRYYKLTDDKRITDGLSVALLNDVEFLQEGRKVVDALVELGRHDLLSVDTKSAKSFVGDLAKGATVVATSPDGAFSLAVFEDTISGYLESLSLQEIFRVSKKPSVRISLTKIE